MQQTKIIGDEWRSRRRLLTPAFHFKIIEGFFDVFNDRSQSLLLDLKYDNNTCGSDSCLIDVGPLLKNVTLDIICGRYLLSHNVKYVYF